MPTVRDRRFALVRGTALTLLVGAGLGGCTSGPSSARPSRVTHPATTETTKPSSAALYDWQRATGAALSLGGGATTTLSSIVAPGAGGKWLIAGTQFSATGPSVATVWTSANTTAWSEAALPVPVGAGSTAADAATGWGPRQVVVGSAGTGNGRRAAVWVSPAPGQAFAPIADDTAFQAPSAVVGSSQAGAVMDAVTAGALGVFAAGTVNGQPTIWYSTDGRHWQVLSNADTVIDQAPGAAVNDVLSTPAGVFAGGTYTSGNGVSPALWYSSDGIHWTTVHDSLTSPFGLGDQVITSLVGIGPVDIAGVGGTGGTGSSGGTGSAGPVGAVQSGLLAVGGARTGSGWQPSSWISPNGSSWSQISESFPLDAEPSDSPGALAYAAADAGGHMFAVGGSPGHQRLWESTGGLAWSAVPLPPAASGDPDWHLGLVAADQDATVLADNMPGQPYVLVRRDGTWYQPSADGAFGRPLPTAVPTSLVNENGALVMSVQLFAPTQALGRGSTSVAVLASSDGRSWRAVNDGAFRGATVNQLLAVPGGLMAVGAAPLSTAATAEASGETGAFASLSVNDGATWPREPIGPANLGGPGTATRAPGGAPSAAGTVAGGGLAGGAGTAAITPLTGPFTATAAGRLGDSEYVIGNAGREAVGWYSPDGTTWEAPQPLDPSPQLSTEFPLATCWGGSSAVVVGTATSTVPGTTPAAWVSTDGSSWTGAAFSASGAAPAGSSTTLDGCLSTGNGFIAYGGSTGKGVVDQPALWTSADGTTWQQLPAAFNGLGGAPTGPEVAPLDGIALGTTTWLGLSGRDDLPSQMWPAPVGGSAGAQLTPAGLWTSGNAGGSWQQLDTSLPAFDAAMYAQADEAAYVGQDPVVAGTVDGRLAIWLGTPAAKNPGG